MMKTLTYRELFNTVEKQGLMDQPVRIDRLVDNGEPTIVPAELHIMESKVDNTKYEFPVLTPIEILMEEGFYPNE